MLSIVSKLFAITTCHHHQSACSELTICFPSLQREACNPAACTMNTHLFTRFSLVLLFAIPATSKTYNMHFVFESTNVVSSKVNAICTLGKHPAWNEMEWQSSSSTTKPASTEHEQKNKKQQQQPLNKLEALIEHAHKKPEKAESLKNFTLAVGGEAETVSVDEALLAKRGISAEEAVVECIFVRKSATDETVNLTLRVLDRKWNPRFGGGKEEWEESRWVLKPRGKFLGWFVEKPSLQGGSEEEVSYFVVVWQRSGAYWPRLSHLTSKTNESTPPHNWKEEEEEKQAAALKRGGGREEEEEEEERKHPPKRRKKGEQNT